MEVVGEGARTRHCMVSRVDVLADPVVCFPLTTRVVSLTRWIFTSRGTSPALKHHLWSRWKWDSCREASKTRTS